jgi:hypothetical protein
MTYFFVVLQLPYNAYASNTLRDIALSLYGISASVFRSVLLPTERGISFLFLLERKGGDFP